MKGYKGGTMPISTEEKRKIGKKSRADGKKFEILVRHDLERRNRNI